jgi:hypothetical protein
MKPDYAALVGRRALQVVRWIQLPLTVLLVAAPIYATPILSFDSSAGLDNSSPVLSTTAPRKTVTASSSAAAGIPSRPVDEASTEPPPDGCVFSGACYSMVKVPEPQSLVMVGSGLLSMAELIRRRIIR